MYVFSSFHFVVDIRVGKCTVDQLMLILNPCMRKFYMNYRTDPNIDCK